MRNPAASDAEYLAAVQRGDLGLAQQMVDRAAKKAGLGQSRLNNAGMPEVMFHGSGWSAHTTFVRGFSPSGASKPYSGYGMDDLGFWFTSSINQATAFGTVLMPEGRRPPAKLYKVFLDIQNPLEFSDCKEFMDWIKSYAAVHAVDETSRKLMMGGRKILAALNANKLLERIILGKKDGIIIWKGDCDHRFGLANDEGFPTWAIAFRPNQIKSAEPVTYDDDGNVIPLSQRFDSESDDIRNPRTHMMGININDSEQDFTGQILSGEKTIETRDSRSLDPYIGKRVGIVRTGVGPATLVGYATVGEPVVYDSIQKFRSDYHKHRVAPGSPYDIEDIKFGYPMMNVEATSPRPVKSRGIVARRVNPTIRPKEFPFEWADALRRQFPKIWAKGGNIRGNETFRLWARRKRGERSPTIDYWWEVERPAWAARHHQDHRLPGVIAQIKWGVVGVLGVAGMKRVVEDAIQR